MIYILVFSISLPIIISAFCSLMEAALYAVPYPYTKHLAESGSKRGKILMSLKNDVQKPIAAILILNTLANTGGAAIAGWAVAATFGETSLVIFSILFTLTVLYASEIIPKVLGVAYCKQISFFMARPLNFLIKILSPLIRASTIISGFIKSSEIQSRISQEEFLSMAALGTEEGALDHLEGSVIKNVIGLDELLVRDVLTPRVVVFRLEENTLLKDVKNSMLDWNHSRVPLYEEEDEDHLKSYVNQRDIYRELVKGNENIPLKDIARELETVPELMRVDKLLLQMFEQKEQICAVVDEHGGLAGIITMEDIIEEVVGREIVDEYDTVSDLRTFAKVVRFAKKRKK